MCSEIALQLTTPGPAAVQPGVRGPAQTLGCTVHCFESTAAAALARMSGERVLIYHY